MTVYIHSGSVGSGKTSRLRAWAEDRADVAGILAPDREGRRTIYDLATGSFLPLEAAAGETRPDLLRRGRFAFYPETFAAARRILRQAFRERPSWLAIDEIGPLELEGAGLEPAAGRIVRWHAARPRAENLLLVVRKHLLERVLETYGIRDWRSFSPPDR